MKPVHGAHLFATAVAAGAGAAAFAAGAGGGALAQPASAANSSAAWAAKRVRFMRRAAQPQGVSARPFFASSSDG